MGTCAGLILLAEFEPTTDPTYPRFATLPVVVERNAYGRQLESFVAQAAFTPPLILAIKLTAWIIHRRSL